MGTARHGACDVLEDPALDVREAQPFWTSDPDIVVQLIPSASGARFDFWALAGSKAMIQDARGLAGVVAPGAATGVRFRIADAVLNGASFAFAIASGARLADRFRAAERFQLRSNGQAPKPPQPRKSAFDHMHRLLALDAQAAGLSHREVAGLVFGRPALADWAIDPRHRSNLRYLLQRAEALRDGGYRDLAALPRVRDSSYDSACGRCQTV